jgi:hypothetical protein
MMRGRRVLVLGIAAVVLSGGVAEAHTVHHNTTLGINRTPHGVVQPGTVVTFKGKLRSQAASCRDGSTIELIRVGFGVVDTTTTGPTGRYSFQRLVNETHRWRTFFPGKVITAVHPHNHTCREDASKTIRVKVS